jgi:hypothetical protein
MLFAGYYYWPQIVDIKLNKHVYGENDLYINKEIVFYYVVGFVSIINLIMTILSSALSKLPKALIKVPNTSFWTENNEKISVTRALLRNWILVFSGAINVLSTLFLLALLVINYQDQMTASRNFEWLLPLSFVVLTLCIIYPFVRFSIKKYSPYDDGYFKS